MVLNTITPNPSNVIYWLYKVLYVIYCEIIVNRGVLIFTDFRGPPKTMKIKIQQITISSLIVTCSVWNHEFKNSWVNAFCRNHENWCPRVKVLSLYLSYWWFITRERISQSNLSSNVKPELWEPMRIRFLAKHVNDSMFIEDLERWRQWNCYNITLKYSNIMFISR